MTLLPPKTPSGAITVRAYEDRDYDWVLALNEASVPAVNSLTPQELNEQLSEADWTGVAEGMGGARGILIVFAPGGTYRSTNYAWFNAQAEAFVYVDRILVSEEARGQGLGRALYEALAAWATEAGFPRIGCEVNEDPPNPVSMAFHERLGFQALTSRINPADGKQVRMLEYRLS
ncbi:MAG: GNAT family N-acetyltransferase [Pseudomonadota bacterium]